MCGVGRADRVHISEKHRQGEDRKSDARGRDETFPGEPRRPGGNGVGDQSENCNENRRAAGEQHPGELGDRRGSRAVRAQDRLHDRRASLYRGQPACLVQPLTQGKNGGPPSRAVRRLLPESYCFFSGAPVLGGVLLPEPMPLLGVLGDVVLLPPLLGVLDEPPEVPPAAPLLAPEAAPKCASHSAREIWPSLFLSTSEKLGALLLAPVELLPDALGALSPPDAPVDDEPELCAMATLARANSAAAVAVLMSLNIGQPSFEDGM